MRTFFMDRTADFYSRPSYASRGGGFNVFSGSRRQRGGGIIGALRSFFMPIFKDLSSTALTSGMDFAQDILKDKMMGKNLKQSLISRGKEHGGQLAQTAMTSAANRVNTMVGKGRRRGRRRLKRGPRRVKKKRRRPKSRKPTALRKRRKRAKSAPRRGAKRRRVTTNF